MTNSYFKTTRILPLLAAVTLLSGCSAVSPPGVGGFIDKYNVCTPEEQLSITDFVSYQSEGYTYYTRFLFAGDSELLLQLAAPQDTDRIYSFSLTYEGETLTGESAAGFRNIVIICLTAMTGYTSEQVQQAADGLCILQSGIPSREQYVNLEDFRCRFIPTEIGGSFICEASRFIEEKESNKPDAKHYSQLFQISGQ